MQTAGNIVVRSPAFDHEALIPARFTADGENISPPIEWGPVPEGTAGLVLVAEDPDAPSPYLPLINWVHWVVYNIPPSIERLDAGLPPEPELPGGIRQGLSSFKKYGYGGPAPPFGEHRYFFRLYALDANPVFANSRVNRKQVMKAVKNSVLASGELMGRYRRKKK